MALDFQKAFQEAQQIHGILKGMRSQQKQERLAPVTQILDTYANQYNTAQTDEQSQQANALANLARSSLVAGGWDPKDIPTKYWGSDPTRGFQTTQGFESPITGLEGLSRSDIMAARRQTGLDKLKERETLAGMSGYDPLTGQPTFDTQYKLMSLANRSSGGGSGGGSPSQTVIDRNSFASAVEDVADSLNTLKGSYGSQGYADKFSTEYGLLAPAQVIEQQINAQRGQLRAQGIDPDKLIDEAYKIAYGQTRDAYWTQANKSLEPSDYSSLRR